MGDVRTNLFAGDDAADLDLSSFKPARPVRQSEEATKKAAARAGFVSREPARAATPEPVPEKPARRVWRTGRNVQFNLKATPETIAEFYAIADAQGWVLGEALEKAVELMREKYGPKSP